MQSLMATALGGLYELGKNMWLFEARSKDLSEYILVDAGLKFPGKESPGVDYIMPDLKFVLDKLERVKALVLTSVHESHSGGASQVILRAGIKKVFGSKLALEATKLSLTQEQVEKIDWVEFHSGIVIELGAFKLTPLQITSCAAHSFALVIEVNGNKIFYSGTYKLDQTPIDGVRTDLLGITSYQDSEQIDLYIGDSINAEKEGYSKSDYDLVAKFRDLFIKHQSRIIFNTYTSNTLRLRSVLELAEKYGRKVAFLNRAAREAYMAAKNAGYINISDDTLISIRDVDNFQDHEILVVSTAPEWDALKELSALAFGHNNSLQIRKGDVVINSADLPPGTVRIMAQIADQIFLKEALLFGGREAGVNADNHAMSEEIKFMFNLVRPRYFVPGFGETRQLIKHAKLAVEAGFDPGSIFIVENGDCIEVKDHKASIIGHIDTGNILFSDSKDFQVDNKVIKERDALAKDGVVLVTFAINKQRKVVSGPIFSAKACTFSNNKEWRAFCLLNSQEIVDSIEGLIKEQPQATIDDYQNLVRDHMNRIIKNQIGKKPSVIVLANEV